eukprot:scaffold27290_cov56-Phaeocystis_antarctica.AAC.2
MVGPWRQGSRRRSSMLVSATTKTNAGVHDSQPLYGEGDVGQGVTRREQRAEDVRTGQSDSDLGVGGKAQHGHS